MKKLANVGASILLVTGLGLSSVASAGIYTYKNDPHKPVRMDHSTPLSLPGAVTSYDESIKYDSSSWRTVNSATLSVKMSDHKIPGKGLSRLLSRFDIIPDNAFISEIEGTPYSGPMVDVGKKDWYFDIDVSEYLVLGGLEYFDFTLDADCGSDFWYYKSKLTVDVTPVPLPAAAWLFSAGLAGVFGMARRKLKLQAA